MKILETATLPAVPFVVANAVGQILRTGSAPAQMVDMQAAEGEYAFAGNADQLSQYITDPTGAASVAERPASPITVDKTSVAADATDTVTLSNVAVGAQVSVTGPVSLSGAGDGSDVVLTFATAGTYTVRVTNFPDLDFEATINAA